MFHAGHVAILKQAREYGDYLIAGVHSDEVVNDQRGLNMPIMNLNERVLSVLGCVYVNDVLIDAPLHITRYVTIPAARNRKSRMFVQYVLWINHCILAIETGILPLFFYREMVASLNICAVVHGTVDDNVIYHGKDEGDHDHHEGDP